MSTISTLDSSWVQIKVFLVLTQSMKKAASPLAQLQRDHNPRQNTHFCFNSHNKTGPQVVPSCFPEARIKCSLEILLRKDVMY